MVSSSTSSQELLASLLFDFLRLLLKNVSIKYICAPYPNAHTTTLSLTRGILGIGGGGTGGTPYVLEVTFFFSCHYDVLLDLFPLIHFQCQTKSKILEQNLLAGKKGLVLRMTLRRHHRMKKTYNELYRGMNMIKYNGNNKKDH